MSKLKQKRNRNRHKFLIEYFFEEVGGKYATKEIGNWVLVQQWNGNSEKWEVAIYTKESFDKTRDYKKRYLLS